MKDTVEAGALSDAFGFIKKLGNILLKGLNKLVDAGLEIDSSTQRQIEEELKSDKWPKKFIIKGKSTITGEDVEYVVVAEPADEQGTKVNYQMAPSVNGNPKGKGFKRKGIAIDQLMKDIADNLARFGDKHSSTEQVDSAARVDVTLQRVVGSKEDSIELVAITANCDPELALAVVDTVVNNDDFVAGLSEEPKSFSLIDEGDAIDVQPIENVDVTSVYKQFAEAAYNLLFDVQCVHWNARGDGFDTLHMMCEGYIYRIMQQIDTFAELHVSMYGYINSPKQFICELMTPDCRNGFTLQEGLSLLSDRIRKYSKFLELFVCNCPADVQNRINMWIRDWNHEVDYVIKQSLK